MRLVRSTGVTAACLLVAFGSLVWQPSAAMARSAAPAARAVDWPRFRFDQNHTGVNRRERTITPQNVALLRPAWQAQLGRLVFSSSPAVVGGVAYIGSIDGTLWAYPADGCGHDLCTQPLWRSTSLAQIVDSPTVADGIVYVGSQTSPNSNDGKLNAFAATGCGQAVCAPLWQGLAGRDSILDSSPTVSGGVVYVGAFDGKLYAFPAAGCGAPTCKPLWTGQTGGTIESTPTIDGDSVLIGSDDGNLYAFPAAGCGAKTCQPTWTGSIGFPVYDSTPAIANGTIYIGSSNALAAFPAGGCGAATCQPLWTGSNQSDFVGGSPAVYKGRVYIGLESSVGVFDANGCGASTCGPLWIDFGSGAQASVSSSPSIVNGVVFAGRNTGQILAWKTKPCGSFVCDEVWTGLTNEPIVNSSPAIVNGTVYIGSADNLFPEDTQGRLYVFDLSAATHR